MIRLSEVRSWPARLLAFAGSTEPRRAPNGAAIGLDALLACIAVIAWMTIAERYPWLDRHLGWAAVAAMLTTTAPLALRRVYPVAVFWVVLLGIVAGNQYANFISFVAVVLAAYSAVVHSRFRGAAVLSVLVAGVAVTARYPDTSVPQPGRFTALFVLVPVVLVGNAVHRWRHQEGDSQERLRRAEAEHQAATGRALVAERSRIASELHDVVTHNVSVMVVQAGAARRRTRRRRASVAH